MQIVYWNLIIFNLLYNLTISDIFICIYTWEDIMILLHFILFKYYPFFDLVQNINVQ